jgi:hypothetical protein
VSITGTGPIALTVFVQGRRSLVVAGERYNDPRSVIDSYNAYPWAFEIASVPWNKESNKISSTYLLTYAFNVADHPFLIGHSLSPSSMLRWPI